MRVVLDITEMAKALGMQDEDVVQELLFDNPADTVEVLIKDIYAPIYTAHSRVEMFLLLAAHFVKYE